MTQQHAVPVGPHQAVAQALTVFEHAVRRHAAAQTELSVSRRPSTSKAVLKAGQDVIEARQALTAQLRQLGWQPPADISLDGPILLRPALFEQQPGYAV